jgi:hypothetical protein
MRYTTFTYTFHSSITFTLRINNLIDSVTQSVSHSVSQSLSPSVTQSRSHSVPQSLSPFVVLAPKHLKYLAFNYVGLAQTWWRLCQKRVMPSNLDMYVRKIRDGCHESSYKFIQNLPFSCMFVLYHILFIQLYNWCYINIRVTWKNNKTWTIERHRQYWTHGIEWRQTKQNIQHRKNKTISNTHPNQNTIE